MASLCMLERKRFWYAFAAIAVIGAAACARYRSTATLHVSGHFNELAADGRMHEVLDIEANHLQNLEPNELEISGTAGPVEATAFLDNEVTLKQRTPVNPGVERLHVRWRSKSYIMPVDIPSNQAASTYARGLPDWMPLHTPQDREAFVRWFTNLADRASATSSDTLPTEISDCAALLRFCFREAIRHHDDRWYATAPDLERLTAPSVQQWTWPDTPLHATLFRTRPGDFAMSNLTDGTFAQFADAKTLATSNSFRVSRDLRDAKPGDLLFYRLLQLDSHHDQQYHSMIVTGEHAQWAVYHTGPINSADGKPGKGEMRRVLLRDLLHHPDPRWRPLATNANFLGVYRWDILAEDGSSLSRSGCCSAP